LPENGGCKVTVHIHVPEGAMNRRKDPPRLQDIAYLKINEMVLRAVVNWTSRLRSAAVKGRNSWLQEIMSVKEKCAQLRHILASLPLPIISEYIHRYAIRNFTNIIAFYDRNSDCPLISRIWKRQLHKDICEDILKTVVFPCICTCNLRNVESKFVQELFVKLLYVIPNIHGLILPKAQHLSYMQLFVERIQILTHLQEFRFHVGCTTEILIELSKYCPLLNSISVKGSRRVDDKCVRHLLKLRHLLTLNLANTSVSRNSYKALLSGLPEIQNVTWFRPIDPVLRNLTTNLPSVTTFTGNISDAELLVHKCPNITELTLLFIIEDITDLGKLNSVATLSIHGGNCIAIRLNIVITILGPTLAVLKLNHVRNINISDLIEFCDVLSSLNISSCHVIYGGMLDPELPHFQNLKELRLSHNWGPFDFCSVLHLYVNLNVLRVVGMEQVTSTSISRTVTAGGLRHVTEFFVNFCGDMSMDTVWLLLQNCPGLTELGNINGWSHVTEDEMEMFLNFLKNNNLSLVVYH
jgi:hypothetical protein